MYLIPFLHQTTTILTFLNTYASCILFHFYIKPQPCLRQCDEYASCILFHFYIKPQQALALAIYFLVVSYSISTSNHNFGLFIVSFVSVVSYSISTSNHNPASPLISKDSVVSYSISTSNHNIFPIVLYYRSLYLIPFLHQTTTSCQ